jgi:TolB-like protein/tRNA A-37 threonylcarbamoyl transferase component Bud32/Flp pilus assembly protein TadD
MIGQTISHYKILEKLGEGGMGVVYKAEDTKLKRTVALKFLPQQLTSDLEAKIRFTQEAKAASALDHPNICTIYDIEETGEGQLFMAMACYEGETLKERITRGPLPLEEAIDIARQISRGLTKAHAKEIVHRDIKPANIFVTDDGLVKILDFGLAKLVGQTRLTRKGTTMGTVAYMSPEQARSEEVDHRTDVWSLGVVLYEMVTGELPFRGEHEQATIYSILNDEPKPLTDFHENVSEELAQVIEKALAKDPGDRYASVGDMVADMRSCQKIMEAKMTGGTEDRSRRAGRKRIFLYSSVAAFVVILVVVGLFLVPEKDEKISSIAVLPLENLSGDPEQEYFADGMTDELISNIAKVSALRVISRTSVMRYKDTIKPLPEIAEELNVDAIVEGSVLRSGNRIRISAQLIHAAKDEEHIWAESYERDLHDILSLQRELARVIATSINIELTPQEESALADTRSIDPEAHEAYLKGRFHWNKRTKEALEKSIDFFERAIARDPGYAHAYVGLADAYIVLADLDYRAPRDCYPKAKALVERALKIDDHLAEAQNTQAYIKYSYEWNWVEAEPGFKRAIELNPSYATARQWYSEYLSTLGRHDEAIMESQRAQELDPLAVMIHTNTGIIFYYSGRFDQAIEQFNKALEISDDFYVALYYLAQSLKERGQYDEAFEVYVKMLQALGLDVEETNKLRQIYNTSGLDGYHRWFVDEGFEKLNALEVIRWQFIVSCAYLGETDLALEGLARCVEEHRRWVLDMGLEPAFAELRSDSRFADLLRQMGLEQ